MNEELRSSGTIRKCKSPFYRGLHRKGTCCHIMYCIGSTFRLGIISAGEDTKEIYCLVCKRIAILGILKWRDD